MSKVRTISYYDFKRDLARGAIGEGIAEVFFQREFGVVAENKSEKNPYFDLIVNDYVGKDAKTKKDKEKALKRFIKKFGETIEVKYDEAAAKYNNLFIEILFDERVGKAGAITKSKADLLVWVIPKAKKKFNIYVFKRAELISWLIIYVLNSSKSLKLKTPAISPFTRGLAIPIKDAKASHACLGEYEFKL